MPSERLVLTGKRRSAGTDWGHHIERSQILLLAARSCDGAGTMEPHGIGFGAMTNDHSGSSDFPNYPAVAAMPPLLTKEDRLNFAFKLLHEHGEQVADYIYAAFRHASTPDEMVRWDMISQVIEEILGRSLEMTYDAAERLVSEGVEIPHLQEAYFAAPFKKKPLG